MLSIIEQKMCADDRKIWARYLEQEKKVPTLQALMLWMTVEMKSCMCAPGPIRSTFVHKRTVTHVTSESSNHNILTRHKCWLCSNSSHWPDQCIKFAGLNVNDHHKVARENHVCFSCLKKAGRDHKAANCSRRKQCPAIKNGKRCNGFHHHLLHKEENGTVNISNSRGFFKRGNVLLDSGAQISLIHQETAEKLGLKGQDVSVNIRKVGGEEETLKTKNLTFYRYSFPSHTVTRNSIQSRQLAFQ